MSWAAPLTWTFKLIPTFTTLNTEIRDKLLFFKTLFDDSANLAPPALTSLALSANTSGAITPTQNAHSLDTFSAGASGDLATLTIAGNIRAGHLLILSAANVAHVVTVKDGTGNIALLGGDCVLSSVKSFVLLQLIGTTWREICRSLVPPTAPTISTASAAASITISGLDLQADYAYEFLIETSVAGADGQLSAQPNASGTGIDTTVGQYVNQAATQTPAGFTAQAAWDLTLQQVCTQAVSRFVLMVGLDGKPFGQFATTFSDSGGNFKSASGGSARSNTVDVTSIKFSKSASTCDWRVITRKLKL